MRIAWIATVVVLLGAVVGRTSHSVSASPQNPAPNTLTAQEARDGWKLLWDGKTQAGWRGAKLETFPAGGGRFRMACCRFSSRAAARPRPRDIVTIDQYASFELTLEYRITRGANSGVKYFVDTGLNKGEGSSIGCEFQILDDAVHPTRRRG